MEHESGQPQDRHAGGDLSPGDDQDPAGQHGAGQQGADREAADQEAPAGGSAGPPAPEDVAGGAEVTGEAQAGPPGAPAGGPEAQVEEAIAGLDGLPGRPLAEHVAVFEAAHAKLRQVLSDLDDGPADS